MKTVSPTRWRFSGWQAATEISTQPIYMAVILGATLVK